MKQKTIERFLEILEDNKPMRIEKRSKLLTDRLKRVNFKLYKYYSLSSPYTISNLENDIIYFNNACQFNDPFDCNIGYSKDDFLERMCLSLILEDFFAMSEDVMEAFTRLILGEDLSESEARFFNEKIKEFAPSYEPNINVCISQSMEKKLKLICYLLCDDGESTAQEIIKCYDEMKQLQENIRKAIDENFVISCFSESSSNELMWAHYADKHRGICVEYDFSQIMNDANLIQFALMAFPVIYSRERPIVPIQIINKGDFKYKIQEGDYTTKDKYKYLLTKSISWKYEKEWRIVLAQSKPKICKVPIISKIFLGANISSEDSEMVEKLAEKKGIPTKRMRLSVNKYELLC